MFTLNKNVKSLQPTKEDIEWIEYTYFWLFEIFGKPKNNLLFSQTSQINSIDKGELDLDASITKIKSHLDLDALNVSMSTYNDLTFLQRNMPFLKGVYNEKLVTSRCRYNLKDEIELVEITLAKSVSDNKEIAEYLVALEITRIKLTPFLSADDELFEHILALTTIYFGFGIHLHNYLTTLKVTSKFGVLPIEIVDYSIAWLMYLMQVNSIQFKQNHTLNDEAISSHISSIKNNKNYSDVSYVVEKCHSNYLFYKKIDDLTKNNNFKEAIEVCRIYQLTNSENDFIEVLMADCYLNLKMYDVALLHYKQHLKSSPDNFEIRSQLGLCHIFLGNINIGEQLIYTSYKKSNINPTCLKNLGILHLIKHSAITALNFFKASKSKKRDLSMIDFYLAYTNKKLNKDKEYLYYLSKHKIKNSINNSIFEL